MAVAGIRPQQVPELWVRDEWVNVVFQIHLILMQGISTLDFHANLTSANETRLV